MAIAHAQGLTTGRNHRHVEDAQARSKKRPGLSPTDLMKAMGVESGRWESVPTEQITTFLEPFYNPSARVLAWVRCHTFCYPYNSPLLHR